MELLAPVGNIDKLKKRYPDGFDTNKSIIRLDGDLH